MIEWYEFLPAAACYLERLYHKHRVYSSISRVHLPTQTPCLFGEASQTRVIPIVNSGSQLRSVVFIPKLRVYTDRFRHPKLDPIYVF